MKLCNKDVDKTDYWFFDNGTCKGPAVKLFCEFLDNDNSTQKDIDAI